MRQSRVLFNTRQLECAITKHGLDIWHFALVRGLLAEHLSTALAEHERVVRRHTPVAHETLAHGETFGRGVFGGFVADVWRVLARHSSDPDRREVT